MENDVVFKIAEKVKEAGGRCFYVGGYVRDRLMGIENKDIDVEVHGIAPVALYEILQGIGKVAEYGNSFGIYSLKGEGIDIAMPRSEKARGKGHRDFDVEVDPFIGYEKAARRRDFTINALMQDVLSEEILDYFGGLSDLNKGIIRHIDEKSFVEDPLRVLRAAQFASRLGFEVDKDCIELCKKIDISTLSKERVEEEVKKALVKGKKPSVFFDVLKEMDQMADWFPEIGQMIGIRQDPFHHPEGDVYTHTMQVLDRSVLYREKVSDVFSFSLLCLCHDMGKVTTTEEIDGKIHAYGHEKAGLDQIRTFLRRFTNEKQRIRYVLNMTELHMKAAVCFRNDSHIKTTNHLFDEATSAEDLIWFSLCDKDYEEKEKQKLLSYLQKRLSIYHETMERPYVKGDDLIAAGLVPDERFSAILAYAHKLRLAGAEKNSALAQCLSYAKKLK